VNGEECECNGAKIIKKFCAGLKREV